MAAPAEVEGQQGWRERRASNVGIAGDIRLKSSAGALGWIGQRRIADRCAGVINARVVESGIGDPEAKPLAEAGLPFIYAAVCILIGPSRFHSAPPIPVPLQS